MNVAIIAMPEGGKSVAQAAREVIVKLEACAVERDWHHEIMLAIDMDQAPILAVTINRRCCKQIVRLLSRATRSVVAQVDRCVVIYSAESFEGMSIDEILLKGAVL